MAPHNTTLVMMFHKHTCLQVSIIVAVVDVVIIKATLKNSRVCIYTKLQRQERHLLSKHELNNKILKLVLLCGSSIR